MGINQGSTKIKNIDQIVGLTIMGLAYILFIFSSFQYRQEGWFFILLFSRIIALVAAIMLTVTLYHSKTLSYLDSWYYTFCFGLQSLHGILEGSTKIDFYSFTGLFYIITALSTRTTFSHWFRKFFPLHLFFLLVPLFFKSKIYFSSLAVFVDSFSLPIVGFVIGTIITWINTQRFKILEQNLKLKEQLTEFQEKIIFNERQKSLEIAQALEEAKVELSKNIHNKIIASLASQVSHDIRSPLAALNMMMRQFTDAPENHRVLMRSAISRINDIANQLLEMGKQKQEEILPVKNNNMVETQIKLSVELLSPLIDSLISLKRVQFREKQGIEIESDINLGYGLFANVNPTELHRTLSNILNNSIEAMPSSIGKVGVTLKSDQDNIFLIVKDNGKGIPAHILAKLGEMGVSHGKEGTQSGSGLGIYHAKKTIESFGGKFEISSIENQGTTIIMTFPKTLAPKWFVEKLVISPLVEVVSLDDDLSIHQIWKGRFESLNSPVNHLTFTSGTEFKNFINQNLENKKRLYLIDFELLNQSQTGLDIIEELNIGTQSILVTSRYEEESIRSRCESLGVKLIPKTMAGFVPIEIEAPKKLVDVILIDDDQLIHLVWQSQAKKMNKSFVDFYTFDDFLKRSGEFDLNSTIYIDSNLKDGVKGEEVSKIAYEKLGFKNIYLCTGYSADTFSSMPWIKGIMGKELKF